MDPISAISAGVSSVLNFGSSIVNAIAGTNIAKIQADVDKHAIDSNQFIQIFGLGADKNSKTMETLLGAGSPTSTTSLTSIAVIGAIVIFIVVSKK